MVDDDKPKKPLPKTGAVIRESYQAEEVKKKDKKDNK